MRDKRVNAGWAHPCVLQALAYLRGIRLRLWVRGDQNELQQHPYYPDFNQEQTDCADLLFVNGNHFERLEAESSQRESTVATQAATLAIGKEIVDQVDSILVTQDQAMAEKRNREVLLPPSGSEGNARFSIQSFDQTQAVPIDPEHDKETVKAPQDDLNKGHEAILQRSPVANDSESVNRLEAQTSETDSATHVTTFCLTSYRPFFWHGLARSDTDSASESEQEEVAANEREVLPGMRHQQGIEKSLIFASTVHCLTVIGE